MVSASSPDEERARRRLIPEQMILPLVIASALFLENMDSTVLATSLPAIALDLGIDPIILKLAFTSYLLSLAVFIPISGWMAERFGARHVFRIAIAVFTLASMVCAFTTTLPGFIAARFFQGMGGAMMVPVGRFVLVRAVPKSELVQALSYLTLPALIGPVIGPLIGGFLTTYLHWRWIFFINLPMGLIGIILATRYVPDVKGDNLTPLDGRGFLLSGLGLSSLVFGLTILGRELLPVVAAPGLILFGFLCLALYALHARLVPHPILKLKLLKLPTFRTSVVGGFLFRAGIGSNPFLLPLMLQIGFGLSAFQSGSLTFASSAGALIMKFTAPRILKRFGFRQILVVNGLISAAFFGAIALFSETTPHILILAVLLTGGFFRSLQFTCLNAIAYAKVEQSDLSRASSFASVVQQISGSMGVAFAAIIIESLQFMRGDLLLKPDDFRIAFAIVSVLVGSSVLFHRRLDPKAGADVSGHTN
ncbi:MAG: MFS transporter [Hyphomicrobiales bacterium]